MNNFPNFGPPPGANPIHHHPHPAQSMSMPRNSINQPQQGFGMGGMPMMPYVAQPQARTNQASSAASLLGLRPSEQAYYDKLFAQADIGGNGQLTGNAIKNLFTTSKLPKPTLATIWTLADRSKRKYLDRDDFYVALKLIAMAQQSLPLGLNNIKQYAEISPPQFEGIPVPVITPGVSRQSSISGAAGTTSTTPFQPSLGATFFNNLGHAGAPPAAAASTSTASSSPPTTNSSTQPAVDWSMNDTARVQYSTYFGQADTDQDGYVSGAEAHKFFTQSGLDNATLRQIWVMADLDKDNKLNAEEFAIAMHLALKVRKQYKLPDKLPEVLDPRLRNQPKKTPAPEPHAPQSSVPPSAHPSHIPANTSDDLFGFGPSSSPSLAGTRATPLHSPPLSQKSSPPISLPPAAAAATTPAASSTSSNPLFDFDSSSSGGDPFAGMKPASVPADSSFDADFDAFPTPGASAPAASASASTPLTAPAAGPGPAVNVPRGASTGSNASAASFDDFGFGLPASTSAPPVSLPSSSSSISNASSTTPRGMSIPPITSNATLATMSKVDQIRTASDEHAAMTRAVRDSFGQLEMANTNVGTTKDKIEALRQQTFQMRENHEMNLKQLLVVEAQHQQLQAQYEQHAATHASEESKYLEVKEKYDAAVKALNELQDEMKQGNDHIHQWQAETVQMKAEIKNIDANMVLLEQQLQQLRSELKAVEDLKSSQQQVLQARRDQQARLLREKQDISDLLEQSQAELEALKNETTLTSAAIQQHTKAAGELKRMLAEHTEIVQSLKDTPVAQRKPVNATTNSVTDAMARLMGDAPISKSPTAAVSATSTRSPTLSSVHPSPSMDSNASFSSSLSASATSPHKRQPSVTLNPGAAEEAKKMAAATAAQLAGDDDAFTFDDVPSFEGDDGSNPFGLGADDITEPTQEQSTSKKSPANGPTIADAVQTQLTDATAAAPVPAPAPAVDDDPFGASSFDTSHLAAAASSSDNPFGDTGLSLDSKSIDTGDDPFAAATTSVDTDFDTGGLDDGGFGDFAADGKKKKKKDKETKKSKKRSEIAPGGAPGSSATSPTPGSEPSAAWAQDDSEWGF